MRRAIVLATLVISTIGISAYAKSSKKKLIAEAKKQCLAQDANLAGKKLQQCIRETLKK